jgi:hypothetical protein
MRGIAYFSGILYQGVVSNSIVMNNSGSVPISKSKYKYNPGFALVTERTGRPSGAFYHNWTLAYFTVRPDPASVRSAGQWLVEG